MNKSCRKLFMEHKGKMSDKWSFYLDEWDRLFFQYQEKQIQMLEIGVQNGGSLEIWGECFPNAIKIIGCDIDQNCKQLRYEDPRIVLIVGDANSDDCENEISLQSDSLDIIIDDGSHHSRDIIRSFGRYFPHLSDDGIYVIEDLHSSYWKDFGGGLNYPLSAIEFFKRLADVVNYEHWRNNKPRNSLFTKFSEEYGVMFDELSMARIHSIEFLNSLCIIKKMSPEKNVLGKRIIIGSEENVVSGWKKFDGIVIHDLAVETIDNSDYDIFNLMSKTTAITNTLQIATKEIESKQEVANSLQLQVREKESSVQALSEELLKKKQLLLVYAHRIMIAEQTIRQLTSQIVTREQVEANYAQQVQELAEIKSSHAWQLVKLIWKVRSLLPSR